MELSAPVTRKFIAVGSASGKVSGVPRVGGQGLTRRGRRGGPLTRRAALGCRRVDRDFATLLAGVLADQQTDGAGEAQHNDEAVDDQNQALPGGVMATERLGLYRFRFSHELVQVSRASKRWERPIGPT